MNKLFAKLLAALLAAALLLSPVALMEELEAAEPAPVAVAEPAQDAPADAIPAEEGEITVDTVDEIVPEAEAFEADSVFIGEEAAESEESEEVFYEPAEDEADFVSFDAMAGTITTPVTINEVFPDTVLQGIINEYDTTDPKDGKLSAEEIALITELNIGSDKNVTSLEGIQSLTALKTLECNNNKLTTVDVSGMDKLETLAVSNNQITALNVTGCTALRTLKAAHNSIASALNLDNYANLVAVDVSGNAIPTLTVKGCANLQALNCDNNSIAALDVSGLANLISLNCAFNAPMVSVNASGTSIPALALAGNTALTSVDVHDCVSMGSLSFSYCGKVSALNIDNTPSLVELYCTQNQLTSIDVSGRTHLERLRCAQNPLTSLNVKDCTALTELKAHETRLTALDVGGLENLVSLDVFKCALTSLNVSGCKSLVSLDFCENSVSSVDVSASTALTSLCANYNRLTALDVSALAKLIHLNVGHNLLTALDVSKNAALQRLYLTNNGITQLDITGCPKLVGIIIDAYRHDTGSVIYYDYGPDYYLGYDKAVTLTTGAHVDPPPPAPVFTYPTIRATASTKRTVTAAVGTVYQLYLGSKTGKRFTSSKKSVATVDASGLVTVRGYGTTKIRFKVGLKKRVIRLTVKDPTVPNKVSLIVPTKSVKKGDVITLTPAIPANTYSNFSWKSSNKRVATVSNGVVTFKKKGRVTITCTAKRGKKKARVTFRVNPQ